MCMTSTCTHRSLTTMWATLVGTERESRLQNCSDLMRQKYITVGGYCGCEYELGGDTVGNVE